MPCRTFSNTIKRSSVVMSVRPSRSSSTSLVSQNARLHTASAATTSNRVDLRLSMVCESSNRSSTMTPASVATKPPRECVSTRAAAISRIAVSGSQARSTNCSNEVTESSGSA